MPIYEYQCESCNHELERIQKLSDPVLTDCPACGKAQLRRKISAPSFRLKGGGWYETDFKSGNKKNLAGESSTPSTAAAGSSSGEKAAAPAASSSGGSSGGTSV